MPVLFKQLRKITRDVRREWAGKLAMMRDDEVYELALSRKRMTRSQRANAYYFAAVATPFYEFLRAQEWDIRDVEEAHRLLKYRLLTAPPLVDPTTGEAVLEREPETHAMEGPEFADYIARARAYLWDVYGIPTYEPDEDLGIRQRAQEVST